MINALKHVQAILALPFMVVIVIPTALIVSAPTFNPLWGQSLPVNVLLAGIGFGPIIGGCVLIISTIRLFMKVGQGTLAPRTPTQHPVVVGPYRYVRNPMISGVIAVLLGEVVLLGSTSVMLWAAFAIALNLIYIPLVEEPGLHERFGKDYGEYVRHVPRWIPRRTPCSPPNN